MTTLRTREDFVQAARFVPKNGHGVVTAAGYLLFFLGVGSLIIAFGGMKPWGLVIDWRLAAASMVLGGTCMAAASALVHRGFRQAAKAAGFSAEDVREIEAEAELLNGEEGL